MKKIIGFILTLSLVLGSASMAFASSQTSGVVSESETSTSDQISVRAMHQWAYSDTPFGGIEDDYSKKYKTAYHTVDFGNPIVDLSGSLIAGKITAVLVLSDARAAAVTVALFGVTQAANKIKAAASKYEMETKVKETMYVIPGDYELRYKHVVEYYTPKGTKLNISTTYYSMYI